MSRLLRCLLTIFGALIVVLGGLGTGEPFVAAAADPTPPVSLSIDEPVYSLTQYEENRFDSLSAPNRVDNPAGPTAPSVLIPWSKIVFQSYQDTNYEIFVMNDDGGEMMQLTHDPGNDIHPRLNRDASRVVFASQRSGDYEIFVINRDGTGLQQLTFNDRDDVDPVWSPDGTYLAFQSYRDGQPEIYLMNADGSGQTRLTYDVDYDGMPGWSPNGSQIIFTSRRTGGYRVYVMGGNGSGLTQLSSQPYSLHPSFSPDGSKIAYDADGNGDGFQEIWTMSANGSNQVSRYISTTPLEDNMVRSWSPNGSFITITTVQYVIYQGNWYWTNAYLRVLATQGSSGPGTFDAGNRAWNPDWQMVDITPPQSAVSPLPQYTRLSAALIRWSGSDTGVSGLGSYDVQYRAGGSWTAWKSNTSLAYGWFTGLAGGTNVEFRSRARDEAGNLESWPVQADAATTLYSWKLTAKVTDNRGLALLGVPVTLAPTGINSSISDQNGLISTWLKSNGAHTLSVNQAGYKPVPATSLNSEMVHPFYLRPQDDLIVNGTFETAGSPVPGWSLSGSLPGTVSTTAFNTGSRALTLGATCSFPCLTASETIANTGYSYPDMVVDHEGTLHVIWHNNLPQNGIYYRYRTSDGSWSTSTQIASTAGSSYYSYSHIALDAQGKLHVAWSFSQSSGGFKIYYINKAPGGSWTASTYVSNGSVIDMQIDTQGRVHILADGMYYILRETNGTWNQPVHLKFHEAVAIRPGAMAIDQDDNVHFAWFEYATDVGTLHIYYRQRMADGTLLAPEEIMSGYTALNTDVQKIVLGDGVRFLFFAGNHQGYLAQWTVQSGWSTPEAINNTQDGVDAALDAQNVLHVLSRVYYGNPLPSTDGVYYRQRIPGQGWSAIISLGAGYNGYGPKMVMDSQSMLHIVWESMNNLHYHTKQKATITGSKVVQQAVAIPNNLLNPTLAFMTKGGIDFAGDNTQLAVVVSNGVITTTVATPIIQPDWTLHWVDMSAWAGQTVTVSFSLHQANGDHYLQLFLDDVSLGSAHPDTWLQATGPISALPGKNFNLTLTYGNRSNLLAENSLITMTLPANISYVSATVSPISTQPLVWDVGDLAGGSGPFTIGVTLSVSPSAPTMVTRNIVLELGSQTPELFVANNNLVHPLFVGARLMLPLLLK